MRSMYSVKIVCPNWISIPHHWSGRARGIEQAEAKGLRSFHRKYGHGVGIASVETRKVSG